MLQTNHTSLFDALRAPLCLQMVHVMLCVTWNILGVYLVANGMPSPGPSSSWTAAAVLAFCGCLLVVGAFRSATIYGCVSLVFALAGAWFIVSAFTRDPSLWSSEAWRYGGVLLQSLGVAAAGWGAYCLLHFKKLTYRIDN